MVVTGWTGITACALQSALRMSREAFAAKLGVSARTVARWHDNPNLVPRPEMQSALDTMLDQAPASARQRFDELTTTATEASSGVEAFRAAIAVVVDSGRVLLVCRRGETPSWQFPAGTIKPGGSSEAVAVSETLAETGVHVSVRRHLGQRLHPVTNVLCDYWLCDYLAGELANRDPVENADVLWCPIASVSKFIPTANIYPPILEALEAIREHQ
jgi:8-oxo-dGTP diphosphatase